MMRVFVYEHLTAHGIGRDPQSPDHGMYREGHAMRNALVADLEAVPGLRVVEPPHADLGIVIAPETAGMLAEVVQTFRRTVPVIAPTPEAIALSADKLALADHWRRHGVRTPHTVLAADWSSTRKPVVVKPRDGAGSCDTFLFEDGAAFRTHVIRSAEQLPQLIAQDFVPGQPASVSFLIGPNKALPLLPTFQTLTQDGRFHYLGGELPIPPALAERAIRMGRAAIECVPGLMGYIGVDQILGPAEDGSQDYSIEINPRLTTSYIGLRTVAEANLAGVMLALFQGQNVPDVRWKSVAVRFRVDGETFFRND